MRSLRLARVAAEAEAIRLRHRAQRTGLRIIFGVVAGLFLLAMLVCLHVAVWFWISIRIEPPYAALIVAGGDLVLALLFALLAARSSPSRAELEALEIRRRALDGIGGTVAWVTLAVQLLRALSGLRTRDRRG